MQDRCSSTCRLASPSAVATRRGTGNHHTAPRQPFMQDRLPIPRLPLLWAALVLAPAAHALAAPPRLPAVIGDGMVLQRETLVPIWAGPRRVRRSSSASPARKSA